MKAAKFPFFRRVTAVCPSTTALTLVALVLTVAATTESAQTNVFVPGNATGCFGNPHLGCAPLVAALTVSGPAKITVTYVSGLMSWQPGATAGPDGCLVPFVLFNSFPLTRLKASGS